MPEGCGTWPAIWETGITDWPYKGETDILEGVNDAGTNSITLHTFPNCTMPRDRPHTGSVASTDCNALTKENLGCGVKDARPNSYGPAFNKNGGGWLAMERTETAITVWFWERNGNPPDEVRNGGDTIETDHWVSLSPAVRNVTSVVKYSPRFLNSLNRLLSSPTGGAMSRHITMTTTLSSTWPFAVIGLEVPTPRTGVPVLVSTGSITTPGPSPTLTLTSLRFAYMSKRSTISPCIRFDASLCR